MEILRNFVKILKQTFACYRILILETEKDGTEYLLVHLCNTKAESQT